MHTPRKTWLLAFAVYAVGKMIDGVWGGLGEKVGDWLRTFIPPGAVNQITALGFWWGAGLVIVFWGLTEAFSPPPEAAVKKKHWLEEMAKRRAIESDASVIEVVTYIYERTRWEGGTANVLDQLGREIADKLAARRISGWVRRTLEQPLIQMPAQFWDNITIDVLGAIVVKPHMHGGVGTYYDLRLSWVQVKAAWPSHYPAFLLPLLQLIRVARRMDWP